MDLDAVVGQDALEEPAGLLAAERPGQGDRLGSREGQVEARDARAGALRGERAPVNDRGVLEQVMAISVSFALVLFAVWFFIFAGSSLPG